MRFYFLLFLPLLAFLTGCERIPQYEREEEMRIEHLKGGSLQVDTNNGSITVKRKNRSDIVITSHVRANSKERLKASQAITNRDPDGVLQVYVNWAENKREDHEGCDFEIEIPEVHGVTLNSTNGKLDIQHLAGTAQLRNSNGAISVLSHAGDVRAQTTNGEIVIDGSLGKLDLSTSNAKIQIFDAESEIDARTSNANISIELTPESSVPIDALTSNGTVFLTIGDGFSGAIDAITSNGTIQLTGLDQEMLQSQSENNGLIQIGKNKQKSLLRTSNASIHVRKR